MKVIIIKVTIIEGQLLKEDWKRKMQIVFLANAGHKNRYYIDKLPIHGGYDWEQKMGDDEGVNVYFTDSVGYTWIQKK